MIMNLSRALSNLSTEDKREARDLIDHYIPSRKMPFQIKQSKAFFFPDDKMKLK